MSVTNNSPSQDSNHPDDLFQSTYFTPGFKPFSQLPVTCSKAWFNGVCVGFGFTYWLKNWPMILVPITKHSKLQQHLKTALTK